jgi:putative DNA primase/helicase
MTLSPDHRTMLVDGSAIAEDVAQERGYCTLPTPAAIQDRGFSRTQAKTAPALGIPLWDVHGVQRDWQIRPDAPRTDRTGKPIKYETPTGHHLFLDVHPRMQPQLGNPAVPLWITEGIRKEDSLTSQGACTIGLFGGVWGFRGTNEHGGKVILPDWNHVALNGRDVYIAYDSDVMHKDTVQHALRALCTFLHTRQARPAWVVWPEPYCATKCGVDDFFAQHRSLDELLALLQVDTTQRRNGHTPPLPVATAQRDDYPYSDAFNAHQLVQAHKQEMRYSPAWRAWLTWTGTHWQRDTDGLLERWQREQVMSLGAQLASLGDTAAKDLLAHIKSSLSTARLKAAVEQAHTWEGICLPPSAFDTQPWVLNCTNGTLDLTTGALREHAATDYLTKCLPMAYDPAARCPTWMEFLEKVLANNAELILFVQKALGYSLTGSTREQCFFLLHGPTKTGKSTFLGIAKALLGPYGTQAEMSTFLHKDRETIRNDLADLAGMRLVSAIETDDGKRLAEALIKQLTGGTDSIKARFLFEEYFEYRPQFKVFLASNHKPRANPTDDALWERVKVIPFVIQIPKEKRDKKLEAKLLEELPGILAWAVRGCLAWQQADSLGEPAAVLDATQQYREEMNSLTRFLDECCLVNEADYVKVQATRLASAYQTWCRRTGETPLSNTALITALEPHFERKRGTGNQYYWHGISLATLEDEPPLED